MFKKKDKYIQEKDKYIQERDKYEIYQEDTHGAE